MEELKKKLNRGEVNKKLSRSGMQLTRLKDLIERHPLMKANGAIVAESLNALHLQTALRTAGPHSQLLLSFYTAFIGSRVKDSEAGMIGEGINAVQIGFVELMALTLEKYHPGLKAFLLTAIQMIGIGGVFLTSEVLGNWEELFRGYSPTFIQSSGALYRELSMLFVTASGLLDGIFKIVAEAAGLSKESRQIFTDIGRVYLLLVILYASESEKNPKVAEMWESLQQFLKTVIPSVELSVEKGVDRQVVDAAAANFVLSQLQVIKTALESRDVEALQRCIEGILTAMGVSREVLMQDLNQMRSVCNQIAQNLQIASGEASKTVTQIVQST